MARKKSTAELVAVQQARARSDSSRFDQKTSLGSGASRTLGRGRGRVRVRVRVRVRG